MKITLEKLLLFFERKPVRPESFLRKGEVINIALDELPYVVIIEGRDRDKLKSML